MNRSYVIFICTFDLFGEGFYRYTFENLCREKTELFLNDEAIKIFFNTSGTKGEITNEAKAFLKYVGGDSSEDRYVQELQLEIENAKRNEEWRREYMTLLMRDKENIEKGRLEGLAEGKAEEKKRITKMLLQKGTFSDLELASIIGISLEELREIK